MVVVHHVLFFVVTCSGTSSTEPAAAGSGICQKQTAETAAQTKNCILKGLLDKSVISTAKPRVSRPRLTLVEAKASSSGRLVAQANVSSRGRCLARASTSSRGSLMVQTIVSRSGPLIAQTNTSDNGTLIELSNGTGTSREPGLQDRRLAQQGSDFGTVFTDFTHRLAHSQRAAVATGVWTCLALLICLALLTLVVISSFFTDGGRHSPVRHSLVRAPVLSRGTQKQAAISGKAGLGGMSRRFLSPRPSVGPCSSSIMQPQPALSATSWEQLASQRQLGDGAETVRSVPSIMSAMRPSTAAACDGRSSIMSDNHYFCSDLVVPPGCECTLQVPLKCLSKGLFEACDPNGNAVLKVEVSALHQGKHRAKGHLKLVLTTFDGEPFGQCMPSPARIAGKSPEREQRECVLIRASGDPFALVKLDEGQREHYTLTMLLGGQLQIWGSKRDQALNVVDSEGKLVAMTCSMSELGFCLDPENASFNLRVAPLMDVGLIFCGLMCIQFLMQ